MNDLLTRRRTHYTLRAEEFRAARDALVGAHSGMVIVIRGETGSGKSSLLERLAETARSEGVLTRPLHEPVSTNTGPGTAATPGVIYVLDDADALVGKGHMEGLLARDGMRTILSVDCSTPIDPRACVLSLDPLDAGAAREYVYERAPMATPSAVDMVVDWAAGCLALLEQGADDLRSHVRPTHAAAFGLPQQYSHLRDAFVAASPEQQLAWVAAAVQNGSRRGDAPVIVDQFLARVGPEGVRLRSSVHRAAVLSSSSPEQLRAAHAEAAKDHATAAHRRPYHSALARDDDGAALSDWARVARHATTSERIFAQMSAAASANRLEARRRVGLALSGAGLAGDLLLAEQLLHDERVDLVNDPNAMTGAALTRGLLHGDAVGAVHLLRRALDLADDDATSESALVALALVNVTTRNDIDIWNWWSEAAARCQSPIVARVATALKVGLAGPAGPLQLTEAPLEAPLARRSPVDSLAESLVGALCPELSWRTAGATASDKDHSLSRGHLAATLGDLVEATRLIREGRWAPALTLIDIASHSANRTGNRAALLGADALRALVHALRGDTEAATTGARRVLSDPMATRLPRAAVTARHALLHVALQSGNDDALFASLTSAEHYAFDGGAYPAAWMLDLADGVSLPGVPDALRLHGTDLVPDQVRRHDLGERISYEYLSVMTGAGSRMVRLRRLLQSARSSGYQYETARIRFSYATELAAAGDHAAALVELEACGHVFDALGVAGWATRVADARLALIDARNADEGYIEALATTPVVKVPLTEQEMRVATLAAAGLSNKEIAERLMVSPRTVGGHLYNVFPKLGVRARAGLRDALTRHQQAGALVATAP